MLSLFSKISIWIWVISWGFWLGAMVYEFVVIVPLWSSSMPSSIIEWNARPGYVVAPTRFFAPVAILTVISSVLAGSFSFRNTDLRLPTLTSAAVAIITLAFTAVYFFPKNEIIYKNNFGSLDGDAITALGRAWIIGCLIRVAIMIIGYGGSLLALHRSGSA